MKKMMKKVMGKPMKAQKGKKAPMYDDDANDRLMADTYAEYMREKQAAERAKAKPKPAPKALPKPTKTVAKPMKSMKMGGVVKKAQLGMKSVKAGYDNNKGVTRADFVSIGKGEAKKGTKMKKAQMGTDMMQSPMMQSPMMKKGGAMKKCKYGCK
jgi:hypothetical protein